ncbi:MAG: hypothetical protein WCQ95_14500, partial [Bacteroidota bacterium]
MKKIYILLFCAVVITRVSFGQVIVDSCFSSATPGTSFGSSASLANVNDSDLTEWTGSSWTGGWPSANVTLPPPTGAGGCRAVFMGNGSSWTTGGEGFGVRLVTPMVAGQNYLFSFTYVSHGFGSDGNFSPFFYTNSSPSLAGAYSMGNLPGVGYAWTTNSISFTATAAQAGHNWIIFHSGSTGSSGLVSAFCCPNTVCSVNIGPDTTLCQGQTLTLNATTTGATYLWQNNSTNPTFTVTSAGTYWVRINVNGCIASDTIHVTYSALPTPNLGTDTTICQGQSLTLNATTPNSTYHWQDNTSNPTLVVNTAGTYSVTVTNNFNCAGTDAIQVAVSANPTPTITGQTSFCQ